MLVALANYYYDPKVHKEPFRDVVEIVESTTAKGDVYIHATDTSALAFAYYAPELESHFLAGDPDYLQETNRGRAQKIAGLKPENLDEIVDGGEEFWLIVVLDHNLDYQSQVVDEFDGRFNRLSHENIHGVDILKYESRE
jgi:hypothetical protein